MQAIIGSTLLSSKLAQPKKRPFEIYDSRGIAFFFLRAPRTGDVQVIAAVARDVVIADALFTATAVVIQPTTGIALALMAGYPLGAPWLRLSTLLYTLVGCCWLPVVWLQVCAKAPAAREPGYESPVSAKGTPGGRDNPAFSDRFGPQAACQLN